MEGNNGKVGIDHGKVVVFDPIGEGSKPAKISSGKGVILFVNSKKVETEMEIWERDIIEVKLSEDLEEERIEVKTSNNDMIADARVIPRKTIKYEISDRDPEELILLQGEPVEIKENVYSIDEVKKELYKKNIVAGIDENVIIELAEAVDEEWRTVARGQPAKEGTNGFIEYLCNLETIGLSYDNKVDKINYRERYQIPSVSEGDVLAICHPPVLGKPGFRVNGEKIEPKPVDEAVIYHKEGVHLAEEGSKAVASITGRPILEKGKKNYIKVTPLYTHQGDVDMKSGNLHFNGSLRVMGNINEGMLVQAHGDISVQGRSAGAVVQAGEGIVFHQNVINCQIEAGKLRGISQILIPKLSELVELLKKTLDALGQIKKVLKARGEDFDTHNKFLSLLKLIIEKKYPEIYEVSKEIIDSMPDQDTSVYLSLNEKKDNIVNLVSPEKLSVFKNLEQLHDLIKDLEETIQQLDKLLKTPADIEAPYVQNSKIRTSGNINVYGPGCYNSVFYSGGEVNVEGVFRGGKITAEKKVVIGEAGSPNSFTQQGEVYVSDNSAVYIRQAYSNFKIYIGERKYHLKDPQSSVKICLGEDGIIKAVLW